MSADVDVGSTYSIEFINDNEPIDDDPNGNDTGGIVEWITVSSTPPFYALGEVLKAVVRHAEDRDLYPDNDDSAWHVTVEIGNNRWYRIEPILR